MSEYQYYEFQAIDRPLTEKEQGILRGYSGRARITVTRFVNNYSYGGFKGDVSQWMEKYFDAFLYMANWGTHRLMLRLPASLLSPEWVERYCVGHLFSMRVTGKQVILDFRSEEEGGKWIEDDNDTLSSLVHVRAELADGNLRALYISWLGGAQSGELDQDDEEPPCPPGLGKLSGALEAFADFLRVDQDLIAAASTASPDLAVINEIAVRQWVLAKSEEKKTDLLVRLIGGAETHLRGQLLRQVRESCASEAPAAKTKARTVAELLEAAEDRAEERRRQQAEQEARENARREKEEAAAREVRLNALAKREGEAWQQLEALIATKRPQKYDEAIVLVRDLCDVCVRAGRQRARPPRALRGCAGSTRPSVASSRACGMQDLLPHQRGRALYNSMSSRIR